MSNVVTVKSKVEISQNFVAFSEYMNFNLIGMWVQSLAFGTPNEKELVDGSDGDCLQIPIRS